MRMISGLKPTRELVLSTRAPLPASKPGEKSLAIMRRTIPQFAEAEAVAKRIAQEQDAARAILEQARLEGRTWP